MKKPTLKYVGSSVRIRQLIINENVMNYAWKMNEKELMIYAAICSHQRQPIAKDIMDALPTLYKSVTGYGKALNNLESMGLIKRIYSMEEAYKLVKKGVDKSQKCSICKELCYKTDNHHYPVPKAHGGKKTIEVCPDCHRYFHDLTGNFIPKK